jgi:hypothetical protein
MKSKVKSWTALLCILAFVVPPLRLCFHESIVRTLFVREDDRVNKKWGSVSERFIMVTYWGAEALHDQTFTYICLRLQSRAGERSRWSII